MDWAATLSSPVTTMLLAFLLRQLHHSWLLMQLRNGSEQQGFAFAGCKTNEMVQYWVWTYFNLCFPEKAVMKEASEE